VLEVLASQRFVDVSPEETWATLLDEGTYLCSTRTMYRILKDEYGEVRDRRDQLTHPPYAAPELLAEHPNELWSWDISKLKGPVRGTWFYLYVILDVFSRYIVGWTVQHHENAELATALIEQATEQQQITPKILTLHADRGAPMRAKLLAQLLEDLGIAKTHSRPYTSSDNPYSEAGFKTLKYRPAFPARFQDIEHAREHCRAFVDWYNHAHRHSGIGLHTASSADSPGATIVVDQDVAVGQIEDARVPALPPAALPELPNDLHRHERLARAGGQCEEEPLVPLEDGGDRSVDGGALVGAGLLDRAVGVSERPVEGQEEPLRHVVLDDALPRPIAGPRCIGRGEGGEPVGLQAGVSIVLDDAFAIRGVGERKVEESRIVLRLLKVPCRGWRTRASPRPRRPRPQARTRGRSPPGAVWPGGASSRPAQSDRR